MKTFIKQSPEVWNEVRICSGRAFGSSFADPRSRAGHRRGVVHIALVVVCPSRIEHRRSEIISRARPSPSLAFAKNPVPVVSTLQSKGILCMWSSRLKEMGLFCALGDGQLQLRKAAQFRFGLSELSGRRGPYSQSGTAGRCFSQTPRQRR